MSHVADPLGIGIGCNCAPKVIAEFVQALHADDPDRAAGILGLADAAHDGEPEGFLFAVMALMFSGVSHALNRTPAELMEWVTDAEREANAASWPEGGLAVMSYIAANLDRSTIRVAYDAWIGTTPDIKGRLMVELAALAMSAFEGATGHAVDGSCLKTPCPHHERVRRAASN